MIKTHFNLMFLFDVIATPIIMYLSAFCCKEQNSFQDGWSNFTMIFYFID